MAPGHALVTGGASGIGLAIAEALADAGWAVTLLGRSPERLAAAKASRDSFETVSCDVGDAEGVAAAIAGAAEARGPVSLLVNCAGGVTTAPFEKAGLDQRSEEHTSELPSLMRNSYAVFCLKN